MTNQASEVREFRSRSEQALRKAAQRTSAIVRSFEREFWTGVLTGMRWGKGRVRAFHSAFDQMVTHVEYRAGKSAETVRSHLPQPAGTPAVAGTSNGGESRPDRAGGFSAPVF
jgi:hypothetical protein